MIPMGSELSAALGYIGPGAGLGLLGALIGLLLAVASGLFFVVLWPLRVLIRKKNGTAESERLLPQEDPRPGH